MKQVDYLELKEGEIRAMRHLGDALSALLNVAAYDKYARSFIEQIERLEEGEAKISLPYSKMLMLFATELKKATDADPLFRDHVKQLEFQQFARESMGLE